MTIASQTVKLSYSGDDSTTEFAITFVFWDDADIRAIKRVDATGVETVLTLTTHYTLTGGSGATGELTTTAGNTIATGETLIIKSDRDDLQTASLPLGGEFPSTTLEQALDQIVRLIQQKQEELERAIKFAESSPDTDITFPDITGNADKIFRINSGATAVDAVTLASLDGEALTTPVALGDGGTAADLSAPTATEIVRINAAGTAMETRSLVEVIAQLFAKGGDIASADPLVIDDDGSYFDVTGTTDFASMTVEAGRLFALQFDGALTMTDGASLDLGGASVTTATGDRGIFYATAANTAQLISWIAEGVSLSPTAQATSAAVVAETNEDTYVPPDLIKHSPGVAKWWCVFDGTAADPITPDAEYNVVDVTDVASGKHTINIDNDMDSGAYAIGGSAGQGASQDNVGFIGPANADPVAGAVQIKVESDTGSAIDCAFVSVIGYGALA